MMSLPQIAAAVAAVGSIGGAGIALDKMHVPAAQFEQYIKQQQLDDERQYVKDLKKEIRHVKGSLAENPDELYLIEALADLLIELCEIRPADRLCTEE